MGRISTKENKTVYQISREALGYSREKASEVLGWISPERIEKIENEYPHLIKYEVTANYNYKLLN